MPFLIYDVILAITDLNAMKKRHVFMFEDFTKHNIIDNKTSLNKLSSAGIASVVLERACEVYQNPGTYLAYQGDEKYLTCSWNGTDNVNTFQWTLNGNLINPNISFTQ